VGDLAALPEGAVVASLGNASGSHLAALAHGIDHRAVEPERAPKSIGHEETFAHDHHRRDTLGHELVKLADATATRLRAHGLAGRTVTLKVRFGDFRTITRSTTVEPAISSGPVLARTAKALLAEVDPSAGVRLIGISVSGLAPGDSRQLTLDAAAGPSWDDADAAIDRIRERYGPDAVGPAALSGPDGVRTRRQGEQQWGPSAPGKDLGGR
jgi:DNA polymerase-4